MLVKGRAIGSRGLRRKCVVLAGGKGEFGGRGTAEGVAEVGAVGWRIVVRGWMEGVRRGRWEDGGLVARVVRSIELRNRRGRVGRRESVVVLWSVALPSPSSSINSPVPSRLCFLSFSKILRHSSSLNESMLVRSWIVGRGGVLAVVLLGSWCLESWGEELLSSRSVRRLPVIRPRSSFDRSLLGEKVVDRGESWESIGDRALQSRPLLLTAPLRPATPVQASSALELRVVHRRSRRVNGVLLARVRHAVVRVPT